MNSASPLLVIDLDRTGAFPADALAQALGLDVAEIGAGIDQALEILTRRRASVRYAVVDIGLRGEEVLAGVEKILRAADPGVRLVVIGNINDLRFYRSLKALGVFEYFTHPAAIAEIRDAFTQHSPAFARNAPAAEPMRRQGTVISVVGAASGDGASTVALNVAHGLARGRQGSVVLVDMDYQFGMIARHVDVQAPFGIRELFDHPDRGVDATLIAKMLVAYGDGLKIISAPDALRPLPDIRPETVRELLAVLREQFDFVVLDVPHLWAAWTAEALLQSDRVLVVAQLWLRSLTHFSRLLTAWQSAGISRDRVLLAVNRSGAKFREAITPQDFERICLKTINFYLANDTKTVVNAENQGKTILEVGTSLLERQFYDVAQTLAAIRSGGSAAMPVYAPNSAGAALLGGSADGLEGAWKRFVSMLGGR